MINPGATLAKLGAMLLAGSAGAFAGGEVSFDQLKGTYLSSLDGGCSLELHRDATYMLSCASQPSRRGEALVMGQGFIIATDAATFGMTPLERPELHIPAPARPSVGVPQWPPSTQDPTSGPFVVEGGGADLSVWLEPLRWGSRVYLIPGGDYEKFCRAVRTGAEPRTKAVGEAFLRRGDHRKRAGPAPPPACSTLR